MNISKIDIHVLLLYEEFGTTGTVVSGKITVDSMTASSESTGTNAAEYGDYKRYSNAGN